MQQAVSQLVNDQHTYASCWLHLAYVTHKLEDHNGAGANGAGEGHNEGEPMEPGRVTMRGSQWSRGGSQ